jgi:hypothetical protein
MLLSHLARHISLTRQHTLTLFQVGLYIRMYKKLKARKKSKTKPQILLKEAFQGQK